MVRKLLILITAFSIAPILNANVIARLVKVEGQVYIKRLGMNTFSETARAGSAIVNGDEIKVGDTGFAAAIYIDDRSVVKIKNNSKFSFMDSKNTRTIDLQYGTLLNKINKTDKGKAFRIQTPVSVASVKGTEFAAIVSQKGVEQFICKEGLFEVLNMVSGQTINVGPGQKAFSNATGDLVQAVASPKDYPDDPEINEIIEPEIEKIIEPEKKETKEIKNEKKIDTKKVNQVEPEKTMKPENDSQSVKEEKIEKPIEKEENDLKKPEPGPPPKPFSMGLGIGSVTLDGVLYNQIALRPEINIGKIGIGLDLVLYLDNEGNIRNDEWDIENDPGLILDKILYVKYGEKNDPGWVKYGSIEGMTLGYGGLMNNYSNMMEFPTVRRVGINTGFNIGPVGGEVFLSNIKDYSRGGTVTGLRIAYTVSENFPLSIGVNYVSDGNMFSGLKDKDEDSYPDIFDDFPENSNIWNDTDGDGIPDPHDGIDTTDYDIDSDGDNLLDKDENPGDVILKATPFSLKNNIARTNAYAFDVGYPIYDSKLFKLKLYGEYNNLSFPAASNDSDFDRSEKSGSGITVPGLASTIFGILNLSIEYRIISGSYIPQFFDQAYDLNRVTTSTINGQTIVQTKDMALFSVYNDDFNSKGLYGSAGIDLFNLINFSASYANMKADTSELKSFSSYINLNTENIPKVSSAMAYYQRNNDDNPFDFNNPSENTIMGYSIGYELSKGVSLVWNFRQFYREDGTGSLEAIKQTTIETTFNF